MATDPASIGARDSGSTAVIAGIMSYLEERRLQPGDRLPSERDLAEALATLAALRMLESRPNSGIYLRHMSRESSFEALVMLADMGATPTPTEVAETMEVRAHLETLAVRLACERRTDEDIQRLEDVLARTDALLLEGGNIVKMDTEFHMALVDATHNSVLVRVLNAFYRFTARRRSVLFADREHGRASALDHRRLLKHIVKRDAPKAEAAILRHMDRARSYWSIVLGKPDSRGE
jgi:GntR family transcriptional repressor for pyruvate dehydrogenase complex